MMTVGPRAIYELRIEKADTEQIVMELCFCCYALVPAAFLEIHENWHRATTNPDWR